VARRAEKKRRGWFSGLRDLGLAAQKLSSLYLFYFLPTLSILDSNLNVNSNLKTHSNKLQIKPKELQVSHTNIFIFPRNFVYLTINLGI
jgi:hypothetical protein